MSHTLFVGILTACLAVALGAQVAAAREIHVATTGSDSVSGGKEAPYLTIGKAAADAQCPADALRMERTPSLSQPGTHIEIHILGLAEIGRFDL